MGTCRYCSFLAAPLEWVTLTFQRGHPHQAEMSPPKMSRGVLPL